MSKIYTIGFTKKSAENFFKLLTDNAVKKVIDVRLNNSSQLAGFSKGEDLKFFLKSIGNIEYVHEVIFAPTKEILDDYKKGKIDWKAYETQYDMLMRKRKVDEYIEKKGKDYWKDACLLCSEELPENCHRRLASMEIMVIYPELDLKHLF